MSHESPDPTEQSAKFDFWRSTPPALFPSIMGLIGLGLAWRAAALHAPIGISGFASSIILFFAGLLFLAALTCYTLKARVRPLVVVEDMASVPGRAGVSAMTVSMLLFAALMTPISPLIATITLFLGLAAHCVVAALALIIMFKAPEGLIVSPAWHLSFVGFIVAGLSAAPLGFEGLARLILILTVLSALAIYGISLLQMSKGDVPEPIRPMLAIHLAPVSLFASVAALLGHTSLAQIFAVLAISIAGLLVSRVAYLTAAGFSPLWGAFTFPIAALSVALFNLSESVGVFGWLALLPLALATIATPFIAVRVLRLWSSGALALKTGAARA